MRIVLMWAGPLYHYNPHQVCPHQDADTKHFSPFKLTVFPPLVLRINSFFSIGEMNTYSFFSCCLFVALFLNSASSSSRKPFHQLLNSLLPTLFVESSLMRASGMSVYIYIYLFQFFFTVLFSFWSRQFSAASVVSWQAEGSRGEE